MVAAQQAFAAEAAPTKAPAAQFGIDKGRAMTTPQSLPNGMSLAFWWWQEDAYTANLAMQ